MPEGTALRCPSQLRSGGVLQGLSQVTGVGSGLLPPGSVSRPSDPRVSGLAFLPDPPGGYSTSI